MPSVYVCACAPVHVSGLKHSHQVPDDAGSVAAGGHTLLVVALDLDVGHRGLVLGHGLQQPVAAPLLQLPHTHLQTGGPVMKDTLRRLLFS